MSGHCTFCNVWHSGSCCHPGRAELDQLRQQLAATIAELGAAEAWRIVEHGWDSQAALAPAANAGTPASGGEACGCGKPWEYETTTGRACNKYFRCKSPEVTVYADPPAAGDAIADTLRTLLQERNHRTDGDLQALADRCLHLSRGDRDLIDMRGSLADEYRERAVTLRTQLAAALAGRERAVKLLRRVHHDLLAGSRIDVQTCYAIAAFVEAAIAAGGEGGRADNGDPETIVPAPSPRRVGDERPLSAFELRDM